MDRGNRRDPIFLDDRDRRVFLKTLGETCERTGWIIHSYVLMPNHYHWLLETPEPNLSDGMHWFQGTYAQRFVVRHDLVGHVFQGRYKALLIEADSGDYFRTVSEYIHLNPARARLLDPVRPELARYRWSSFPWLIQHRVPLPSWLEFRRVAQSMGLNPAVADSRRAFHEFLQARACQCMADQGREVREQEWEKIRHGWCYGSEEFAEEMVEHVGRAMGGQQRGSYGGRMVKAHDEHQAEKWVREALRLLGLTKSELLDLPKNDVRKQAIAWLVRTQTTMRNDWVGTELGMGSRVSVYQAVRRFTEGLEPDVLRIKALLKELTI